MASAFERLNGINVNGHTEKKNGLTYLSWAWAWAEVKKVFPDAQYTIYERNTEYGPVNYFTDGRTCWVKTGVTIEGLEHIEELPIMDVRNRSIPYEQVNSMNVNTAIQRSLTKACARHGLGLYIYAGEDLPEDAKEEPNGEPAPEPKAETKKTPPPSPETAAWFAEVERLKAIPASDEIKLKIIERATPAQLEKAYTRLGPRLENLNQYDAEMWLRGLK